jgi:phage terminase small subunit
MESLDDKFNWNPLGRRFWTQAALETSATPLQARFAAAKLRGAGHTAAAREAGCGRVAKSQGFTLSKNPKVIAMLAMAATAGRGRPTKLEDARPDGEMSPSEARSILTDIARSQDAALRIRAVDSLTKILDQEAQRDRRELSLEEAFERAHKAAGNFGAQFLVEAFFQQHRSLPWACEPFAKLAIDLAAAFPDRWAHYQATLPGHRLKFEEAGLAR